MSEPVIRVEKLSKHFLLRSGWGKSARLQAVDEVSFAVHQGETLALVGESGSGKSTVGRLLLALEQPTGGEVYFKTQPLSRLSETELRPLRRHLQMVFQDPSEALNPRMTVLQTIQEPIRLHTRASPAEAQEQALTLMEQVGLRRDFAQRYPHQLSGGQQQRVGIARALALNPEFVVFDEPTSALDVSMQAQLLNLIRGLREQYHLASVFISHDLAVVYYLADRVAVLYLGQVVELGTREQIFRNPQHPYTVALMSSIPGEEQVMPWQPITLEGEIPSPLTPPSGCRFHTRCPYATAECKTTAQRLEEVEPGHQLACHRVIQGNGYQALLPGQA